MLVVGLIAVSGASAQASARAAPQIDVQRNGAVYSVRASSDVVADVPTAWATLTDYERLSEFLPDIRRVQVLSRDGNRLTVAMSGALRLLIFEWPVRVRLAVQHEPYGRVLASSDPGRVDGQPPTLQAFRGRYTLTAIPIAGRTGVRLDYEAQFQLTETLPSLIGPLFGRVLVRAAIREQFEALVREIERRQAMQPAAERSTS